MCGSQQNLSDPNVVLNTAVAEQCERFCDYVADRSDEPFTQVAMRFVRHTFRDHQRIIFDGNGYSSEWEEEAHRRGLPNLKTTPDALAALMDADNIALFERYGVLTEAELHARFVAKAEQYAKLINIEANCMVDMARRLYVPAISSYAGDLATAVAAKAELGVASKAEKALVARLTSGIDAVWHLADELEGAASKASAATNPAEQDMLCRDEVIAAMEALRAAVDALEPVVGDRWWPVPTYNTMLYYV
jgi:glutamine synthetase